MNILLHDVVINYDVKLFYFKGRYGQWNFFYRAVVLSELIPYNSFKTFRTELSNRTMSLLKILNHLTDFEIRNYSSNN